MSTSSSYKQPQHSYPLKISLRANRLIQGTLFHNILVDKATGQYFKVCPDGEKKIKELLIKDGWSEDTYEISWSCFEDYMNEFQNPFNQHALYSIISHWDWYISNLGKFIDFAEKHISPEKQRDNNLLKLSFKPFNEQINIIKNQTGIIFKIENETLDPIEEMHLVRNLGLHNQWEVDKTYLKYTKTKKFEIGKKRIFEISELTKWHSAFLQLIDTLSSEVAICYAQVPKYE